MRVQLNMLVMFMMISKTGAIPECLYTPLASQYGRQESAEVICTCKGFPPSYTGNMNFVKQVLSKVEETERNVDLVIKDCEQLRLELNFNNIGPQPINLRIYDTKSVEISMVELALAEDRRQTLVVKNVTNLHMGGMVQCRRCQDRQGLFSVQVNIFKTAEQLDGTQSIAIKVCSLQSVKEHYVFDYYYSWIRKYCPALTE